MDPTSTNSCCADGKTPATLNGELPLLWSREKIKRRRFPSHRYARVERGENLGLAPAARSPSSKTNKLTGYHLWCLISAVGLILFFCGFLMAQDTPGDTPPPPEPTQPPKVLGMESTGTVDLGYRWTAGFRGNDDIYRSLVNLGEGPKLFGANLYFANPSGTNKYIDTLRLNASSWGGDPYNTLRLYAEKKDVYQFSFDYRNVNYFNSIPSFANPLLGQGILIGQHSFDSTRRTMDFELTLRPGATISPFLAYSRNSGFGPGTTTYTADGNEFPVNTQLQDTSDYYRGGVTLNFHKLNLVLEQGFLTFKDDQRIYQTDGTNNGQSHEPSSRRDHRS